MTNSSKPLNPLNPLAESLNQTLEKAPVVHHFLSDLGKRIFFPSKGIVAQSAEAKTKADPRYNATVGIATDHKGPLVFKSIEKHFNTELLNANQIFNYTSSFGNPELRKLWKERIHQNTPSLAGKECSLPLVTGGLTNALSIAADLFLNAGDELILPDQIWGNYRLMFQTIRNSKLTYFSFFKENGFNLTAFKETLTKSVTERGDVRLLLNFPNNPTGYSPTQAEANEMIKIITDIAEKNKVLIILDEAYHGLFFEDDLIKESLFSRLVDHENILAVKICGATKEFFVWGFRIGFITFGTKLGDTSIYQALEQKTGGIIRGNVSNESTSAQNIMVNILKDKSYLDDFQRNHDILKERAQEVKRVLNTHSEYSASYEAYPFNSGYFMLLQLKNGVVAEEVRTNLLDLDEAIGTIATAPHDLRIAFSCVEKENISTIFEQVHQTCQRLKK